MPFQYESMFQLEHDATQYSDADAGFCVGSCGGGGREYLQAWGRRRWRLLAKTAFNDISFYLRTAHLKRLREELDDPEASDNDRFVIYTHLQNAVVAAKGKLPSCQDTGTAIVMGKKG